MQHTEDPTLHGARLRTELSAVLQELAWSELSADQHITGMAEQIREALQASRADVDALAHGRLVCYGSAGDAARSIGSITELDALSARAVARAHAVVGPDSEESGQIHQTALMPATRTLAVVPIFDGTEIGAVLRASFDEAHAVDDRKLLLLQAFATGLGAMLDRQRMAGVLLKSALRYQLIFERNPQCMFVYDPRTLRIMTANESAVRTYGYTAEEFIGKPWADLFASPDEMRRVSESNASTSPLGLTENISGRHRRQDNSVIQVELSGNDIVFDGGHARLVLVVDVTARRDAEDEILNISRAQQMLTACNEALIRADNDQSLLAEVCRIAVDIGGYRLAWVGLAQHDATQTVLPVAAAGIGADVIKTFKFSWSTKNLTGDGAVGRAIRQQETSVADVCDGPANGWEDVCSHFDVKEVICLPLRNGHEGQAFGVLGLYSEVAESPSSEELRRMEKLADNLAFGIVTLQARAEQRKLQEAVVMVAAAVTGQIGVRFFDDLVKHLAVAVGAQSCVVAQMQEGNPPSGKVIAQYLEGVATGPLESEVAGTPFEALDRDGLVVVRSGLSRKFPARFSAYEAFAGIRLNDASGTTLGMLAVFFRCALADTALVTNSLRIFAARAASELERQQSDVRLRAQASLLDKARDAIIVRDMKNRILFWNKSCERLYGYTSGEAVGRSVVELLYPRDATAFEIAAARLRADGEWAGELLQHCKDGQTVTVEGRWNLVRDELSGATSALCINTDVSARKEAERGEHRALFYDALTGLPNRRMFEEELRRAVSGVLAAGECGAVLFLNIDNFSTINKTLGRGNGDQLLRHVGERLARASQTADGIVARTGGDEFLVLLLHVAKRAEHTRQEIALCAASLASALSHPFHLGSYEVSVSACIGVATFGHDGLKTTEEVLQQADHALGQAKKDGWKSIVFYDPSLQRVLEERTALVADLGLALSRHELELHFQPQVDRTGRVIGAEALIRWKNAKRGMVLPGEFIPLAEESGLILSIGQWVIETACNVLARWSATKELAMLTIAVNVSIAQFQQANFVGQVIEALRISRANPQLLKLELTESVFAHDIESVVNKMQTLRAMEVRFSMDDFGTGYSSLSYLKLLPLDQLKIDQSFVRDLFINVNGAAIAKAIIALAHSMGLSVIAEGVETVDQREWLFANGCDGFQGYLYSRPIPEVQLTEVLNRASQEI